MLIVATNLKRERVSDPAFLRRIGYRLHVDKPDEQRYAEIFRRYAEGAGLKVGRRRWSPTVLERYREEKRELRASEPRDLIERCRDICNLRRHAAADRPRTARSRVDGVLRDVVD